MNKIDNDVNTRKISDNNSTNNYYNLNYNYNKDINNNNYDLKKSENEYINNFIILLKTGFVYKKNKN